MAAPVVSQALADQLAQEEMNANMVGQSLYGNIGGVPQAGSDLLEFLSNLYFTGGADQAKFLAEQNGIPAADFDSHVRQIAADSMSNPHGLLGAISGIGNYVADNPALLFGAPFAVAGLTGAFGAGAAGGAGGGVGGGVGGATGSGTIAGSIPAASSSVFSTIPAGIETGATAYGSTAGLGLGGGLGLGLGGAAALGSAAGGSAAATPQGPPEPPQGPPDPIRTIPEAGAGAGAAAAGASGLAGLGLPGWLTLAGVAGSALQGTPDITQTRANEPPAYLAPYLQQAAGAAQTQYGQGNYVAPIQQSAIDYGTNVLNGSYLNSNPWLDATFNKAAGAVTNQVQSNFGRSGGNVRGPNAAAVAGDLYNNLATQIYGGNYQAERDRMQQLVPQAGQLGSVTDPSRALDDYIARLRNIGGNYGTATQTTPTQNNWWSGLAGLGLALAQPGG